MHHATTTTTVTTTTTTTAVRTRRGCAGGCATARPTHRAVTGRRCAMTTMARRGATGVVRAGGDDGEKSRIGLCGLAVMGQNLALNIAEKGFAISV